MQTPFSSWPDLEDLQIVNARDYDSGREDQSVVLDWSSEGDELARVPATWTEEDIKQALRLAHNAYHLGFRAGQKDVKYKLQSLISP
jgi:hypothetical protein